MSVGLIALLDDIAAIAKVAAASLDDIAGQAAKAGAKSAGVVIDDAAVTPRYVVGFAADRELPIVYKIAVGSLRNKLLLLLPAALALGALAPWAITPLLMLGGLYLSYEGAEKVFEVLAPHAAHEHERETVDGGGAELEAARVSGAIKTDFILSAEIMALTLANVADAGLFTQGAVLAAVGVMITVGVYGVVGLIVKADDAGVALARTGGASLLAGAIRSVGRGLVAGMPWFLKALTAVGTAAMIWVGGGSLVHGLATYGVDAPEHLIHVAAVAAGHAAAAFPGAIPAVEWIVSAAGAGVLGLAVGFALIPLVARVIAPIWRLAKRARG
jgi:predicted DNA repair protein MutK